MRYYKDLIWTYGLKTLNDATLIRLGHIVICIIASHDSKTECSLIILEGVKSERYDYIWPWSQFNHITLQLVYFVIHAPNITLQVRYFFFKNIYCLSLYIRVKHYIFIEFWHWHNFLFNFQILKVSDLFFTYCLIEYKVFFL
jgi:hypothetical protein